MMNEVSHKYETMKRTTNKRIKKGAMNGIITDLKRKYGISDELCIIIIKTVQSRFRRNKMTVKHRGIESPMAPLEPALLQIVLQRGEMN